MCLPGTIEAVRAASLGQETGHHEVVSHGHDGVDHHAGAPRVSRRALFAAGGALALTSLLRAPAAFAHDRRPNRPTRLQDLSYTFSPSFPHPAPPPVTRSRQYDYASAGFYAQTWGFWEHEGTHLDAPAHFIPGGRFVPDLDPSELLFVPTEVINIAERAESNPDTGVEVADLRAHERRYGRIAAGAMVLMNSGWGSRATSADRYLNAGHFPGFTPEAAEFLVDRKVRGVGVDTISIDLGLNSSKDAGFPTHHRILGANHFALENIANLDHVPPTGARLLIGVVKWEEGSGGPCRIIAQI
jgi:kynurenine formamidase